MSLYDKYFSKINEDHILKIVKRLILEEIGINIEKERNIYTIFKERYSYIFQENNVETLSELNKILIDDVCNQIMKTFTQNTQNTPQNTNENSKMITPNLQGDGMIVQLEDIKNISEDAKEYILIGSNKRNNNSLNRFNYKVDIKLNQIRIDKFVIPYEKKDIFINDNLLIKINNEDNYLQLKSKNKIDNRYYLTYEPFKKKWNKIKKDELEIKIIDDLDREYTEKDIYEIELIKNIKIKGKEYLCIQSSNQSREDIIKSDKLGLIVDNKQVKITKVISKTDKYILCELNSEIRDRFSDRYSSFINLSLQNKIYCDKS